MSEDYFYNKKRIDDLEEGKIIAIDRLKGRVSLYLRNGLVSTGTYLYDVKDLRVGMNVLIGRVSNSYVIINKITGLPKEAEAACKPKTDSMDWNAFYTASGANRVKKASVIKIQGVNKLIAVGDNDEEMYTEDPTGQSDWRSMCGGATIGDVPLFPIVNESYKLTIVPGETPPVGPLYLVKKSGEGTFVPNTYTPRVPSVGCTGQDVIELRVSIEASTIPEEGAPPIDHTDDDDYRVCQTLTSDIDVTATCGGATIGYTGSLTMKPGDTKAFSIVGAGEHVGNLALSMEAGGTGAFTNGVYTAAVAGTNCMGYATIKLKSTSSETCSTVCDSVSILVDGQPKGNGATIGFTTQQMSVGESQTLTIIQGAEAPYGTLRFNLYSGGGSFAGNTYTAGLTNPGCEGNAGIQLLCEIEGCPTEICDTLNIAVNAYSTPGDVAYRTITTGSTPEICDCRGGCCTEANPVEFCLAYCDWKYYNCDGSLYNAVYNNPGGNSCLGCGCSTTVCTPSYLDTRTPAMIAAGCCPSADL